MPGGNGIAAAPAQEEPDVMCKSLAVEKEEQRWGLDTSVEAIMAVFLWLSHSPSLGICIYAFILTDITLMNLAFNNPIAPQVCWHRRIDLFLLDGLQCGSACRKEVYPFQLQRGLPFAVRRGVPFVSAKYCNRFSSQVEKLA